jgi:CRP/FNR family transcriptional regulator
MNPSFKRLFPSFSKELIDAIERLEFCFKRHLEACGCNVVKLSHQEIASELTTSSEVISRLMKEMEQRGLLKLHRNQIEVLK